MYEVGERGWRAALVKKDKAIKNTTMCARSCAGRAKRVIAKFNLYISTWLTI